MLAIVLPWPLAMLAVNPSQWDIWRNEITGMDAPGRADPWYTYLLLMVMVFLPWLLLARSGA